MVGFINMVFEFVGFLVVLLILWLVLAGGRIKWSFVDGRLRIYLDIDKPSGWITRTFSFRGLLRDRFKD